jgi:large subunit ribosomal protein L35
MGKLKTHKATAKRFRQTGKRGLMKRKAGQDHFNSRESGKTTMGKRRDIRVSPADMPALKKLAPYR